MKLKPLYPDSWRDAQLCTARVGECRCRGPAIVALIGEDLVQQPRCSLCYSELKKPEWPSLGEILQKGIWDDLEGFKNWNQIDGLGQGLGGL